MKQLLLKALLLIGACLGGVSSVWAEGEIAFTAGNTIGSSTEPGGWYYAKSEIFEIPANKTLTLKFKTYSATDAQLTAASINKWEGHMSHVINLWDGVAADGNIFWRADGYAWQTTNPEKNSNQEGWPLFLGANTRWGTDGAEFREDITGSDVVMTIARVGGELRMTQDFSATSGKYRRYFVANYGNANNSIWAQLAVERAYVTVSENYSITDTEVPAINGKQIGSDNNTTAFWTSWTDYFTIAPEKKFTLRYKLYTNRINNYNGGVPYVTTDADRGATDYTEYFGLRPDNWVNVAGVHATSTNYDAISWNWATFREKVDGSTVTVTITRSGANVAIREEFAPADASTTLWEEYNQDCGDGTQNIRVFLTVEGGHLDLLPVTKTMTAAGWATYCSPYALDFTNDIANLTDVYIVTGGEDSHVTTTSVKGGTVPANTGLLLKGTAGDINIPIVGSSTTSVSGNKLIGVLVDTPIAQNTGYVLMNDATDGIGFYKNGNATNFTVGANTAYLPADFAGAGARSFFSLDDETTGINMVNGEGLKVNGSEVYYDLQGRRVLYPTKGLYIVNGKKVIIK